MLCCCSSIADCVWSTSEPACHTFQFTSHKSSETAGCQHLACLQTLSFYKIFGYPSGLGALVVKRTALSLLRKRYFGGGAVAASAADDNFYRYVCRPSLWTATPELPGNNGLFVQS